MRGLVRHAATLCVVVGVGLGGTACATAGGGSGSESSTNVITQQQIQDADVGSLYEVVQQLRPTWLQANRRSISKENEILVIRDGTVIGGPEVLRQIGRDGITEIRWMDGESAAATLVGARSGYVEGAIVIERGS